MSKELCEIIEYIQENYKEDYREIIDIINAVRIKIQNDIGISAQNGDYKRISELNEWLEKFQSINNHKPDSKNVGIEIPIQEILSLEESNKLYVNDTWSNSCPIGMDLQGIHYSAFSWKDILGRVYKVLHDKDPIKFKNIVDNNVLHGRKYSSLSDKKINKEYEAITSTGYYYKSTPMSAEQARSYIKKILEVYKVSIDDFSVSIKSDKKKKIKIDEQKNIDIVYLMDKSKRCPICNGILTPTSKSYLIYEDESKMGEAKIEKTYTKRCDCCEKDFITKDTFLTLQKQKNNFENRINFKVSK